MTTLRVGRCLVDTRLRRPLIGCTHGPAAWPWWRWISFSVVRLTVCPPSRGWALWIYTRGEKANRGRYVDFYLDHRPGLL